MTGGSDRLRRAFELIDAANAEDPDTVEHYGERRPKELVHSEMVTEWVRRLDPDADEAQLLAARAHHLRRWEVPRTSYPAGRKGYLRWRSDLKKKHAEDVARILRAVGYDHETIAKVERIVRKEGLGRDPCVQTHEDALCLVFLETQLAEVAESLGEEKTVEVLRRTAKKMSARALQLATELPLREKERDLVRRALADARVHSRAHPRAHP